MALADNSYGTVEGVAALAGIYTTDGSFDASTRPAITTVERWIDNISGIVNALLAESGFAIPITQADSISMLDAFVEEAVADLCHYANGSGRFYSERVIERGYSTMQIITKDFSNWLESHAVGLENLGATRTTSKVGAVGYRDSDEDGNDVDPLFTRRGFGGSNKSLGR